MAISALSSIFHMSNAIAYQKQLWAPHSLSILYNHRFLWFDTRQWYFDGFFLEKYGKFHDFCAVNFVACIILMGFWVGDELAEHCHTHTHTLA